MVTGSREENASKQESRAPFQFDRNGKGSSFEESAGTRCEAAKIFISCRPSGVSPSSRTRMACPCRCRSRGGVFDGCSPRARAPGHRKPSREIFGHEQIWRLLAGATGERRNLLSKGRVVNRPPAGARRPTKSGVGALYFPASRVPALAGLDCRETVASQAKITLVQQPNLLVLWALAGWVWRV